MILDVRYPELHVRFTLDNRTRWASRGLALFFARGLHAYSVRRPRDIIVVPSPIRSRGCAQIGRNGIEGKAITIALASPSHFDLRRLARLFEHEVQHTLGQRHEDMTHNVLWSLGPVPAWAKTPLRWSLSRKRGKSA